MTETKKFGEKKQNRKSTQQTDMNRKFDLKESQRDSETEKVRLTDGQRQRDKEHE